MPTEPPDDRPAPRPAGKRPYAPPAIDDLGTLQDLTQGASGPTVDVVDASPTGS